MTIILRVERLSKRFGALCAVDDVSLSVVDGEFFALLGPSGCGKTTLLRILGGFDMPDAGCVLIEGKDVTSIPPNKRPVNMVFQSYALFPHLNAYDNVAYGLRFQRATRAQKTRRVKECLALVRMSDQAMQLPHQLSGGQRQRVALARALACSPRILLLDEPLSALDARLRETMRAELVDLQQRVGITFVMVTHDQGEALSMADRVAVMEGGRIQQVDAPPALYEHPKTLFVARFIGRMNILSATVQACTGNTCTVHVQEVGTVTLPAMAGVGDSVFVGVRPEKVTFTQTAETQPACVSVTLETSQYYGDETLLSGTTTAGCKVACVYTNRRRQSTAPPAGTSGWMSWRTEDMIVLRA